MITVEVEMEGWPRTLVGVFGGVVCGVCENPIFEGELIFIIVQGVTKVDREKGELVIDDTPADWTVEHCSCATLRHLRMPLGSDEERPQ
jgi:hypothetical protein